MKRFLIFVLLLTISLSPTVRVAAQGDDSVDPAILSPAPGEALQGNVPIRGNTAVDGFIAAELSFSYQDDSTGSWFQLARFSQPTAEEILLAWDTTTLTDGNYSLRLILTLENQEPITIIVPDLRIRNYTPIETSTVTPTNTPQPAQTPSEERPAAPTTTRVPPSPTPLPLNPAQITSQKIAQTLFQGLAGTFVAFALFGLLVTIRSVTRR